MEWLNEPASWQRTGGLLAVSVDPGTDFWRETGYGHVRDSGHVYGEMVTGDLDVWVRIRASLGTQYDQAGVMLRVDSRTWLKAGLELFEGQPRLSTVVTLGQSSWMVASLPDDTNEITLRVSRRGDGVQVRYLVGDGPFQLAALAYLPPDREVLAGVMCAAPEGGGFSVAFHDLRVAHRDWEPAAEGEAAAGPDQPAGAPAGWQETAGRPDEPWQPGDGPGEDGPEPGSEAGEPWAPGRETAAAWADADTGDLVRVAGPEAEPEFAPEPELADEQGLPAAGLPGEPEAPAAGLAEEPEAPAAGLAEEPAIPAAELPAGPEAAGAGHFPAGPEVPAAADLSAGPDVPAAADLPDPRDLLAAGSGLPGAEHAAPDRGEPVPAVAGWAYPNGTGSGWQGPWTVSLPRRESAASELPGGTGPPSDLPGQAEAGGADAAGDPLGLAAASLASDPLGLGGTGPAGQAEAGTAEHPGLAEAGAGTAGESAAGPAGLPGPGSRSEAPEPAGSDPLGQAERDSTGSTAGTEAAGIGQDRQDAGGRAGAGSAPDWTKISSSAQVGQWATDLARDATGGWAGLPSDSTGSDWPGPPVPQPADVTGRNAPPAAGTGPDDPLGDRAGPASREDDTAGEVTAADGPVPSGSGAAGPIAGQAAAAAAAGAEPAVAATDSPAPAARAAADAHGEQPGEPAATPPAGLPPLPDDPTDPQLPAAGPAGPGSKRARTGPGRVPPRPRSGESSGPRQSARVLGARADAEADADEWISLLRADPGDD